jgi:hypothetical protein
MIGARFALVVAVSALASACGPGPAQVPGTLDSTPTSVVTGHLVGIGGPAGSPTRHWPGTIHVQGPLDLDVAADAHGRFRVHLAPGRYVLTGHSPRYGDGRYLCRARHALVVTEGKPLRIDVVCQLR